MTTGGTVSAPRREVVHHASLGVASVVTIPGRRARASAVEPFFWQLTARRNFSTAECRLLFARKKEHHEDKIACFNYDLKLVGKRQA